MIYFFPADANDRLFVLSYCERKECLPQAYELRKMKKRFIRLGKDFSALTLTERIFDILTVIAMITVTVLQIIKYDDGFKTLQLAMNIAAALALFLSHILFSEKTLFGGLSLEMQKYINIVVLFGSFGGQYFCMGDYISNYDTITHLVTGSVFCLFGLGIYEFQSKENAFEKPALATSFSLFFSMFTALFWELFEFSSDFITGGTCQGYNLSLDDEKFFYFKALPGCVKPEQQYALYDTFADVYAAVITAAVTSVIIYAVLKKKKAAKKSEEKAEVTAE